MWQHLHVSVDKQRGEGHIDVGVVSSIAYLLEYVARKSFDSLIIR